MTGMDALIARSLTDGAMYIVAESERHPGQHPRTYTPSQFLEVEGERFHRVYVTERATICEDWPRMYHTLMTTRELSAPGSGRLCFVVERRGA